MGGLILISRKPLTTDRIDNGVKQNKISGRANRAIKIHIHIFCTLFIIFLFQLILFLTHSIIIQLFKVNKNSRTVRQGSFCFIDLFAHKANLPMDKILVRSCLCCCWVVGNRCTCNTSYSCCNVCPVEASLCTKGK